MARSRQISQEEMVEATPVTLIPADADADDADLQDAYEEWRENLRGSQTPAILRVFRVPVDVLGNPIPNAKGQADLFTVPLDAMGYEDVIEKLRREYIRPGQFSITVRIMGVKRKTENDPARTLFNRIVTVERGTETEAKSGDGSAELIRVVQENANRQLEMMREFFTQSQRPQIDPMEMAMRMTQSMTAMIAAMNQGGGNSTLKEAIELSNLLRVNQAPGTSMKETVESILAVKSLLGDLSGGEGDPDGDTPAGIIKAVSPLAAPVFEALKAFQENQAQARRVVAEKIAERRARLPRPAPKANPSPPAQPAQPATTEAAPTSVAKHSQEEAAVLNIIREQLGTLVQVAAENGDPVPLAETLLEFVPEEYDEQVLRFIDSENCIKVLQSLHPGVKDHLEWFERFRLAMVMQFTDDADAQPGGNFTPEHDLTPQTRERLIESGRMKK